MSTFPVTYLHSALADHHDYSNDADHAAHKAPCITAAGINCHFNHLAVTIPFVYYDVPGLDCITPFYGSTVADIPAGIITSVTYSNTGRGPPSIA